MVQTESDPQRAVSTSNAAFHCAPKETRPEAIGENWESVFLQMGVFVLLTRFLYQRGSSESKRIEEAEAVDQDPREARNDAADGRRATAETARTLRRPL